MTAHEFEARLAAMEPAAKEQMKRQLGCGGSTDEQCLQMFIPSPEWQAKFCHALREPTQADKVAGATFTAARYAVLACVIGVVSLAVSVIALMK